MSVGGVIGIVDGWPLEDGCYYGIKNSSIVCRHKESLKDGNEFAGQKKMIRNSSNLYHTFLFRQILDFGVLAKNWAGLLINLL